MTDETTLLPCPFCHGEAEVIQDEVDCWLVNCDALHGGCNACTGAYRTKQEAINAWNRRYTEDDLK